MPIAGTHPKTMGSANVIAPIKRAPATVIRCGGCKATGVEHKWDDKGNYLPTGEKCPTCAGSGAAPQR